MENNDLIIYYFYVMRVINLIFLFLRILNYELKKKV